MTPTPSPFSHRSWLVGLCCALAVGFASPAAEAGDQPTGSSSSTRRRSAAPNQRSSSPTNRQPAATRQRSTSSTNRQPAATRQRSSSSTTPRNTRNAGHSQSAAPARNGNAAAPRTTVSPAAGNPSLGSAGFARAGELRRHYSQLLAPQNAITTRANRELAEVDRLDRTGTVSHWNERDSINNRLSGAELRRREVCQEYRSKLNDVAGNGTPGPDLTKQISTMRRDISSLCQSSGTPREQRERRRAEQQ